MAHLKIIVLSFLWAAYVSGIPVKDKDDERIVGGEDAKEGEFPYQVSLWVNDNFNCGGSVLNKHFILTAAHCVDERNPEKYFIRAGTNQLSSGGQVRKVKKITVYDKYNPNSGDGDFALAEMAEPWVFSDLLKAINLPTKETHDDVDLIITGFGRDGANGQISETLQKLSVKSVNWLKCKSTMGFRLFLTKNNICALNSNGKGICFGDSGGPLVEGDSVVGVANWVRPCAMGYPDVYAKIYNFVDWIQERIEVYD